MELCVENVLVCVCFGCLCYSVRVQCCFYKLKITYKFVSVEEGIVFACFDIFVFGECVQGMKKIKNEEEKRKYYYRL